MIVDNDLLALLQEELGEEGYRLYLAATGDEALQILHDRGPELDLVITDIKHDGLNGLELLQHIKTSLPGLPVIIHTAYAACQGTPEVLRADAFMVKDSDLGPLKAKIKELLAA